MLRSLCDNSSILRPCIEAWVANIPGTGWDIERSGQTKAQEAEETEAERKKKEPLKDFFYQPWPETTFTSELEKVIRDREETGNGYMEIIRNLKGRVQGMHRIDAIDLRFVKLDAPVTVQKPVRRNGKEIFLQYEKRERRYVQLVGNSYIFYKDFGVERQLNKKTGEWEKDEKAVALKDRSTEIIHFGTNIQDVETPYHWPRWIGNLPSVRGSRKAEEFNHSFWDSGGIPPLLIVVSGGQLAVNAEQALQDHFMTSGGHKHSAAILEAFAAVGDVEGRSNVKVDVHQFGNSRQKDSMWEEYIAKCEFRIQRSFRLPSVFLGFTDQFSFASLHSAYTVAETQVFSPERRKIDEVVNQRVLPVLENYDGWMFVSMPLTVRDVAQQLIAMNLLKDVVTTASLAREANYALDLDLKVDPSVPTGGMAMKKLLEQPQTDRPTKGSSPGNRTPVGN